MTVKELKDVLDLMDDDARVVVCANTPAGWVCPDGAVVDVDSVCMGFDWHQGKVLVVPKHELDIHDVEEWSGRAKKGNWSATKDKVYKTISGEILTNAAYEPNIDVTWSKVEEAVGKIVDKCQEYLAECKVVCDSTVNTEDTIKAGEFHLKFHWKVKPDDEWTVVDFVVSPSGLTYSEEAERKT